jgi:hypothetical protein
MVLADEGDPLETVNVSTSSAVNTTDLQVGVEYTIQCTVTTRYKACPTSSCTASASHLMLPAEPAAVGVMMREKGGINTRLAFLGTGSGTCKIYESWPRSMAMHARF